MKIRWAAAVTVLGVALTITGCGPGAQAPGEGISVVASTDVWGSVASAVGGDLVRVEAIVSDPTGDPHSYQLTPRDAAALTEADLVVFNGGGYDDFVRQALGDDAPPTVEAFGLAGAEGIGLGASTGRDGHGDNEHVWYRLATVAAVADAIADRLAEIRPASAETFRAGATAFRGELDDLSARVQRIATAGTGAEIVATEPIAHYLLQEAGLRDVTPEAFVEAVEEESDPPAAAVAQIQDLVSGRRVALVVHNPQTETPVVTDVVARAREAQLPVVELTETLPAGQDYVTWMSAQIEALSSAAGVAP